MIVNNFSKKFSDYSLKRKINAGSVTYLFKLKDGRLCVCTHEKKLKIYKFEDNNFIEQIVINNYTHSISKIIQLKNGLIVYPSEEDNIIIIELSENSYKIKQKIELNKQIFKNIQSINKIIELKDERIVALINDFSRDKICFLKFNGKSYEFNTYIQINSNHILSLEIEEIPKLNQISFFSNQSLSFYDLTTYELRKKMNNVEGFEWTNSLILFNDDYLILGSIYASCNEGSKNIYLVKCSTYELIDSFQSDECDFMFCTSIKILNNKSILFGFHMYDGFTSYIQIKVENEKINLICIKRLSDKEFDGEICGIEEFENIIVTGDRGGFLYVYQ